MTFQIDHPFATVQDFPRYGLSELIFHWLSLNIICHEICGPKGFLKQDGPCVKTLVTFEVAHVRQKNHQSFRHKEGHACGLARNETTSDVGD